MKLKSVLLYDVTVTLDNGATVSCLFLTPPTTEALAIAAGGMLAPQELVEALSFNREINLPAPCDDNAITDITVAGTLIGAICVSTLYGFQQPAKRGPKKKTATSAPQE